MACSPLRLYWASFPARPSASCAALSSYHPPSLEKERGKRRARDARRGIRSRALGREDRPWKSDRDRQVARHGHESRENVALTRLPARRFPQDGRNTRKRESLTCRGMTALQLALIRAARHLVAFASTGTSNEFPSQYAAVNRCRCQHALTASPSPIQ